MTPESNETSLNGDFRDAHALVEQLRDKWEVMNEKDSPYRSRELSLAITRLQEAAFWFDTGYSQWLDKRDVSPHLA